MGEKDISEKTLLSYNDVFSDIINALIFNGEDRVTEDDLEEAQTFSQYKADDSRLHEEERDVSKYWNNTGFRIACFGMENQSDPDRDMPLRVIGYDGAAYRSQLLDNVDNNGKPATGKQRFPVVSLVLYYGTKSWNKLKLSDCMEIPDGIGTFFKDYSINLFEIAKLPMETVNKFKSDFRVVAEFFVMTADKNADYTPTPQTIKHVDAVLKFLRVMTNDSMIDEIYATSLKGTERRAKMESYFTVLYNRGKESGEAEGKEIGKEIGKAIGSDEHLVRLICRKLRRMMSIPQIAREVEEDEIRVKLICDIAERFAPDYDEQKVFEAVQKELLSV